jgi:hypothetical protein
MIFIIISWKAIYLMFIYLYILSTFQADFKFQNTTVKI